MLTLEPPAAAATSPASGSDHDFQLLPPSAPLPQKVSSVALGLISRSRSRRVPHESWNGASGSAVKAPRLHPLPCMPPGAGSSGTWRSMVEYNDKGEVEGDALSIFLDAVSMEWPYCSISNITPAAIASLVFSSTLIRLGITLLFVVKKLYCLHLLSLYHISTICRSQLIKRYEDREDEGAAVVRATAGEQGCNWRLVRDCNILLASRGWETLDLDLPATD